MTLPTYDEAFADAMARSREGSPFSNSTDGNAWVENWCGRCVHDRPHRDESDIRGCPLILVAHLNRTPVEWFRQESNRLGDQFHCVMFRSEDDPGPDEPTPIPDPPDQEVLFPRDEFVRPARMYADTKPVEAEAAS